MVKIQKPKQHKIILAISMVCVAFGLVGSYTVVPRLNKKDDAELIWSDIPPGQAIGVHNEFLYIFSYNDRNVYRYPVAGGKAITCFKVPGDAKMPRFVINNAGMYVLNTRSSESLTKQSAKLPAKQEPKPAARQTGKIPPYLGQFLESTPRSGETRTPVDVDNSYRPDVDIWQYVWEGNHLQAVKVVPLPSSSKVLWLTPARFGLFYSETIGTTRRTQVINAKGMRMEHSPNDALVYLPLNATHPKLITSGLANEHFNINDDAVCWNSASSYPETKRDSFCSINGAPAVAIPYLRLDSLGQVVHSDSGTWWLRGGDSTTTATRLWELLPGMTKPRLIDPPVRQSEADVIQYDAIEEFHKKFYVRCHVERAENHDENPKTTNAPGDVAHKKIDHYSFRLNMSRAGNRGFWEMIESSAAPINARNEAFADGNYYYFERDEKDKSFAYAVQDLLSTNEVTPPTHRNLYRVKLRE